MTTLEKASFSRADSSFFRSGALTTVALQASSLGLAEYGDTTMLTRGQAPERGESPRSLWEPEPATEQERYNDRLRVMLVDDHKIVREGIARLLRAEGDMDIVAEAPDGQAAVELARQLRPDVILMDITMPRLSGVEATRRISADWPDIRIVGLSMHEPADMARAMHEAGAVAYVSKAGPTEQLLAAIRG